MPITYVISPQFQNKAGSEGSAFGHSGKQTGSASQIFIIPTQKKVVAVLSNTSGTWEQIIGLGAQVIPLFKEQPSCYSKELCDGLICLSFHPDKELI